MQALFAFAAPDKAVLVGGLREKDPDRKLKLKECGSVSAENQTHADKVAGSQQARSVGAGVRVVLS